MWIVQSLNNSLFWTGREWTTWAEISRKYPSGEEAQKVADAFHIASCNYDHVLAKATIEQSQFNVIDYPTGTLYRPPPLTKIRNLFVRLPESNLQKKEKINLRQIKTKSYVGSLSFGMMAQSIATPCI
jgi:hypothetical protein